MKKIVFLATEDWFVRSHFLPLLRRARAEGYDVVVAARDTGALADELGVRLAPLPIARGSLRPTALWREVRAVRALLRAERPDLIHIIALRAILLALFAGAHGAGRVFALTGRGFIGVSRKPWARAVGAFLAAGLRGAARNGAVLLVENPADRAWVEAGTRLPEMHVLQMPGAGVDIDQYAAAPEPSPPPVVIGSVGRLVRSKGIDVLVAAHQRLRAEGRACELHIAGDADPDNPDDYTLAEIIAWRALPGLVLHGRIYDVPAFWSRAHIACAPSRGGEGLPRVLLEAAACGRPLVASNTPGCSDFIIEGEMGVLAPAENVDALAAALRTLIDDAPLRQRMGAAARARVVAHFTEAHAGDVAAEAWRRASRARAS